MDSYRPLGCFERAASLHGGSVCSTAAESTRPRAGSAYSQASLTRFHCLPTNRHCSEGKEWAAVHDAILAVEVQHDRNASRDRCD
jgi:hypothetical protein